MTGLRVQGREGGAPPWFEQCSIIAREIAKLPDDWHAWLFEASPPNGVLVTGAVVKDRITRGRRKGDLNYRKADRSTQCRVFIPNDAFDRFEPALAKAQPEAQDGRDG